MEPPLPLIFKVCKEDSLNHEIKVQEIDEGAPPGQIQNVPKHPNTVDIEQTRGDGTEALYIWTTVCSKPKLKLVYKMTAPQEVTVTVGEK